MTANNREIIDLLKDSANNKVDTFDLIHTLFVTCLGYSKVHLSPKERDLLDRFQQCNIDERSLSEMKKLADLFDPTFSHHWEKISIMIGCEIDDPADQSLVIDVLREVIHDMGILIDTRNDDLMERQDTIDDYEGIIYEKDNELGERDEEIQRLHHEVSDLDNQIAELEEEVNRQDGANG